MSINRIFSLFCCLLASLGIIGALKVRLVITTVETTVPGPGFFPLVYATALFVLGVLFFFSDKSNIKFDFRASLLTGVGGKAFAFFLLNFLLLLLLYLFNMVIAVLVFSLVTCFVLGRQAPRNIVLFSIINTIAFYVVFELGFKLAFQRGVIFRLLGWYL